MRWHLKSLHLSTLLLMLAACDQASNDTAGNVDQIEILPAIESAKDFGDYVVHFNALGTNQLTPDIAREYGIARTRYGAMITLSVLKKEAGSTSRAVSAEITVSAVNLTGQLKSIQIREITEDDSIYYIGETTIANQESLIYTVNIIPSGESDPLVVRFQQQFFVD